MDEKLYYEALDIVMRESQEDGKKKMLNRLLELYAKHYNAMSEKMTGELDDDFNRERQVVSILQSAITVRLMKDRGYIQVNENGVDLWKHKKK